MAQQVSILPNFKYTVPTLTHVKDRPYLDFPLVYNETVTERPFYVEHDFTFVTSAANDTTLYKWSGGGWVAVTGISNPELILGRGFYAVSTLVDAYVSVTENIYHNQVL